MLATLTLNLRGLLVYMGIHMNNRMTYNLFLYDLIPSIFKDKLL